MDQDLAKKIAEQFVCVLQEWLTEEEFNEMKAKNATPEYADCCASHDYCDANMAMEAAMRAFGVYYDQNDPEKNVDLWNAAWDIARQSELKGE